MEFNEEKQKNVLMLLVRVFLGFAFLWAFLDKAFGLSKGWAAAWFNGASVTQGYLGGSTGILAPIFKAMAGNIIVEILFMLGLLLLGLMMILGFSKRLATYGAIAMMVLMWLSHPPFSPDPFLKDPIAWLMFDHHVLDSIMYLLIYRIGAYDVFSLNKWWNSLGFVQKFKWLQ